MLTYKINATQSTNSYLKELVKKIGTEEEIIVVTNNQTHGRGQMGALWQSQVGKSLTFSVFKFGMGMSIHHHFFLSMAVSLAVKKVLQFQNVPDVCIKWPNDILSANKKICGILIENILHKSVITGSIIGIGLNVNEDSFAHLPKATSMKIRTGKKYDLEKILEEIVASIDFYFAFLKEKRFDELNALYLLQLYRKDQESVFSTSDGVHFNGIIRNITTSGKLQVEMENKKLQEFDLKEITIVY
ncbi:MAG: biotin--[acetyl-CoA-carboxylase] ligase [Flavobacteriaceae bacterium CG2_30_34_30]|nr:MAG: biotin--[acetyl-CoA-carboxylase] ligase [Flavobacteriaceae bacterium CG2_30_34_30]PIV51026.1 MAG: biotin--[acetyl-CoA-carboxylase] ligase [Flavobacteriaceae bacterium CG02_land_8_20_14_3_00_34_13]PIZ06951.1 MAG: biotin--[acetyl-CoA-carboxylase] ligase [Flavobacteriaceae bacterium CG_4_10_14_0_8_um_filter_34_31]